MAEIKGEKLWYIVQTYSGKENAVKDNLIQRITSMDMEGQIFQVIVPEQIVQEKKEDGTIKEKVVKIFPGYVFIEMIDNEQSWWVVRNTPQVTGFLGSAGKKTRPVPVPAYEMEPILKACGITKAPEISYHVGDIVTVIRGNFKDRVGKVEAIDLDKMETTISIEMFGRTISAPVAADDVEVVN
ncbi:transcription termination/antitermination protein NusG [bacterium]|nr:transcription termination/antitermination protein NusG [bacterium]